MSYLADSLAANVAERPNASRARTPLEFNRVGAFLTHLGISGLIFIALGYLVLFVWYPDFFFTTDGGWQGIRIIAAVDLVLGPTLTLIVYRKGKPGLKLDLTLIGLFQGVCLILGTYVVYSERPIAMVYCDGHFYSMDIDAYRDAGVAVPDLSSFPGPWPKWVTLALPDEPHAQGDIRSEALRNGRPLRTYNEYYIPFSPSDMDFARDSYPPEDLRDRDQDSQQIPVWLANNGGALEDYAFFPFGSRYGYMFIGADRTEQEIKGLLQTPAPL